MRKSGNWKDFADVRPEDAMAWLEKHSPEGHKLTLAFIEKYGNRVVREVSPCVTTPSISN